jgi:hypothetical protein
LCDDLASHHEQKIGRDLGGEGGEASGKLSGGLEIVDEGRAANDEKAVGGTREDLSRWERVAGKVVVPG